MGNAIPNKHVKLIFIILDSKDHCHCLANFHNPRNFGSPRSFSNLDLHPALQIITQEVCSNCMQHVHLERSEGHSLLVEVVPSTTQLPGLIPNFLDIWIVLNDDGVFYVATRRRGSSISSHIVIGRGAHATRIEEDFKGGTKVTCSRFQVDTVGIRIETFTEDHPVKGSIELYIHSHVCLFTLNLEMLNLGSIRGSKRPIFFCPMRHWWPILCWWPVDRSVLQRKGTAVDQWSFCIYALKTEKKFVNFCLYSNMKERKRIGQVTYIIREIL